MILIGHMRDQQLAAKLERDFKELGIQGKILEEQGVYQVLVENKEDFPKAIELYRVALGFAPPPKPVDPHWAKVHR